MDSGTGVLQKIPIGVPSIDNRLRGGVRPGTTILAIGPFGTGYHEFLRTAAIMHGNWQAESGLFDLEYGTVGESVLRPSQVRYITVNDAAKTFRRHIHDLADEDVAYPALDQIDVRSLSAEIADLGPMQPSAEGGFEYRSAEERPSDEYEQIFQRFDDLVDGVPGEVVFVDAISDFLPITAKFLDPIDLYFISQTLCHVAAESNSILIAAADRDLLSQKEAALLRRTFEAVLDFDWFGRGSQQRRMMTVTKFPEFWRETEADEHVTFNLEIDREHFGISKVKKIPLGR
jgi:archaellum biogenesis ATPase FlaH